MNNRGLPVKTRILFLSALVGAVFVCLPIAQAATITVTNTNDSGAGSLRQALAIANDGDTIDFSVTTPATITLTSGQIQVTKGVTINGPGANLLAVSGNTNNRVCSVSAGYPYPVTISGLTITNGGNVEFGGGILIESNSSVTLSNCTVTSNSAVFGGGISVTNTFLTVSNCTISGNSSTGRGGGMYIRGRNLAINKVTINNSTISGNSASLGGGGISNSSGFLSTPGRTTVTVNNSTISNNSSSSGGAGIHNSSANGIRASLARLVVTNSTISGNSAKVVGGGIYNSGSGSPCTTCGATASVSKSTVSGNSGSLGGGIYNSGQIGVLTIDDTILKTGASGQNIYNINSGTVTSLGYNLSSDNGNGLLTGPGDQINTDPLLSPLQNNGGPTFTHALLPGSPGINAGNPSFSPPPNYDQRDCPFLRVFGGRIDVGAFESQLQPQSSPCPSPRPPPTPRPR